MEKKGNKMNEIIIKNGYFDRFTSKTAKDRILKKVYENSNLTPDEKAKAQKLLREKITELAKSINNVEGDKVVVQYRMKLSPEIREALNKVLKSEYGVIINPECEFLYIGIGLCARIIDHIVETGQLWYLPQFNFEDDFEIHNYEEDNEEEVKKFLEELLEMHGEGKDIAEYYVSNAVVPSKKKQELKESQLIHEYKPVFNIQHPHEKTVTTKEELLEKSKDTQINMHHVHNEFYYENKDNPSVLEICNFIMKEDHIIFEFKKILNSEKEYINAKFQKKPNGLNPTNPFHCVKIQGGASVEKYKSHIVEFMDGISILEKLDDSDDKKSGSLNYKIIIDGDVNEIYAKFFLDVLIPFKEKIAEI